MAAASGSSSMPTTRHFCRFLSASPRAPRRSRTRGSTSRRGDAIEKVVARLPAERAPAVDVVRGGDRDVVSPERVAQRSVYVASRSVRQRKAPGFDWSQVTRSIDAAGSRSRPSSSAARGGSDRPAAADAAAGVLRGRWPPGPPPRRRSRRARPAGGRRSAARGAGADR